MDNLLRCKHCRKVITFGTYCSIACYDNGKQKVNNIRDEFKSPATLKKLLLKERGNKCEICGRKKWKGRDIGLAIDYIDRDLKNWNVDNLRLLCYNCRWTVRAYNLQKIGAERANGKPAES